jgi:hypothetical protein
LADSLGMTTTAEGVETEEQLSIIREEGCTEVQGYVFSRPKGAAELRRVHFTDHAPAVEPANVPGAAMLHLEPSSDGRSKTGVNVLLGEKTGVNALVVVEESSSGVPTCAVG